LLLTSVSKQIIGGSNVDKNIKILDEEVAYMTSKKFQSFNKKINMDLEVLTDYDKSIIKENNHESWDEEFD
jgi:hypothetical protein